MWLEGGKAAFGGDKVRELKLTGGCRQSEIGVDTSISGSNARHAIT
jgi:hypothetical protein